MKQKMILIVSVVVGLLAALLTRGYLNAKDNEIARQLAAIRASNRQVAAVVLTSDLPAGAVLQLADIGIKEFAESSLRGDVVKQDVAMSLVGRKLLLSLGKNKPVLWSDIEGGDPLSGGLASDVKTRMRALSINVGGSAAVSGMVRPNDHVDVLGTFSFPSAKNGELELVTLTLLQDVTVLATGRDRAKTPPSQASGGTYNSVTLEVTPREAEVLVFAEQIKGRLVLALRNPADVYFEKTLPRVDFSRIQTEIETLNRYRQETLLKKRVD